MSSLPARVAVIGLGYFSQFHLRAWSQSAAVELAAICDSDAAVLESNAQRYAVSTFTDASEMLRQVKPDIVDIVAPPPVHATLIRAALSIDTASDTSGQGQRWIICQKPFCRDFAEAEAVAAEIEAAGARLIIHENFRFQPWYRTLKEQLDSGRLGQVYQCRFNLRPGDGRGADAYLARQPGFQSMPRFLIRETGVHFIDLFRWLFGEVTDIYADLRQLNPAIAGEDAGTLLMNHVDGTVSVFDGNRLQDHPAENHRLTMGELQLECAAATLRIDGYGQLWERPFGDAAETRIPLTHPIIDDEFGGGCVTALITHVIEAWQALTTQGATAALENELADYLPVMRLAEASYASAVEGVRVSVLH